MTGDVAIELFFIFPILGDGETDRRLLADSMVLFRADSRLLIESRSFRLRLESTTTGEVEPLL